jgi:hypothetical protein
VASTVSISISILIQNTTQQSIRASLFEAQKERQIKDTQALANRIKSDLDSMESRLRLFASSNNLQQNDFTSVSTNQLMNGVGKEINSISAADNLYILDKNNIMVNVFPEASRRFIGYDVSSRDYAAQTKITRQPVFSTGFTDADGKMRITVTYPIIIKELANISD